MIGSEISEGHLCKLVLLLKKMGQRRKGIETTKNMLRKREREQHLPILCLTRIKIQTSEEVTIDALCIKVSLLSFERSDLDCLFSFYETNFNKKISL